MKLIVFGATGGTGREIVKQALAQGHEVTAFVRDPAKLDIADDHLQVVAGDVFDLPAVVDAVQGQEAVVCTLGSSSLGKTSVRADGTANIIQAMAVNGVQRLLVISAMGTGESWSDLSAGAKMLYNTVLRSARQDHEKQEEVVKASDLNWTIVRPSGLVDAPLTGQYDVGERIKAKSSRIARADVAHFTLQELQEDRYLRKAVTITN